MQMVWYGTFPWGLKIDPSSSVEIQYGTKSYCTLYWTQNGHLIYRFGHLSSVMEVLTRWLSYESRIFCECTKSLRTVGRDGEADPVI